MEMHQYRTHKKSKFSFRGLTLSSGQWVPTTQFFNYSSYSCPQRFTFVGPGQTGVTWKRRQVMNPYVCICVCVYKNCLMNKWRWIEMCRTCRSKLDRKLVEQPWDWAAPLLSEIFLAHHVIVSSELFTAKFYMTSVHFSIAKWMPPAA